MSSSNLELDRKQSVVKNCFYHQLNLDFLEQFILQKTFCLTESYEKLINYLNLICWS